MGLCPAPGLIAGRFAGVFGPSRFTRGGPFVRPPVGGVLCVMSPRDWRRDADYDPVDELDTSGYAWEFLRRNPLYRSHYEVAQRGTDGRDLPGPGGGLAPHWGLRFSGGPRPRRGCGAGLLAPRDRPGSRRQVGTGACG